MFGAGVHDRLLEKLARAGYNSRFTLSVCPLRVCVEALDSDELEALAAIVTVARVHGHAPYRDVGSFSPYPPARRLLEPLSRVQWLPDGDPSWARKQIEARIRGADAEAFALLDAAVTARRG